MRIQMIITFYVVFVCLAGLVFQGKPWVKSCSHTFLGLSLDADSHCVLQSAALIKFVLLVRERVSA